MFKNFFSFLRHPVENVTYTYKAKDLLGTVALYALFTAGLIAALALLYLCLREFFPDLINKELPISHHPYHWAIVSLLGPFLEECAFRLPLRRYKAFLFIGLVVFSYFIISHLTFSHQNYNTDHLALRIVLAILAGALLYVLLHKPFARCRFGGVFYVSAIVFGCIHIANAHFSEFLPLDYVFLLLYLGKQIFTGVLLGYARLRHGFPASVILHMLNNSI